MMMVDHDGIKLMKIIQVMLINMTLCRTESVKV